MIRDVRARAVRRVPRSPLALVRRHPLSARARSRRWWRWWWLGWLVELGDGLRNDAIERRQRVARLAGPVLLGVAVVLLAKQRTVLAQRGRARATHDHKVGDAPRRLAHGLVDTKRALHHCAPGDAPIALVVVVRVAQRDEEVRCHQLLCGWLPSYAQDASFDRRFRCAGLVRGHDDKCVVRIARVVRAALTVRDELCVRRRESGRQPDDR